MSAKPIAVEVLELLEESREHARFLGELGVDAIALSDQVEQPNLSSPASVAPALTESRQEIPPRVEPPSRSWSQPAGPSDMSHQPAPAASLFGDFSPAEPVLAKSSESLEDIWRDIGDCTR